MWSWTHDATLQETSGQVLKPPGPGSLAVGSSGDQIMCGCLYGEFGPGGDAELGEDVRQVHLDGAGGDEQAPGDGVVPQAFAHEADDLQFGGGEAGPAGRGPLASAALACCEGDRIVEGKCLALFPCPGEAVVAEGMPGLGGGTCSGVAGGGEAGGQVLQRPAGGFGGGQQAGRVGVAFAG